MKTKWNYRGTLVDHNQHTWMVQRWQYDPDIYTEAEIAVDTTDEQVAIKAAIDRNSWA